MAADPFVLSHIRRLPLFGQLSPEQLDAVARAFQQLRYAPGDRLYRQGENSQGLYLFISGSGRILRAGPDGVEREQGQVLPGAYVGEASLFLPDRREVSVMAAQDSIALALPKAQFDAVLNARPDIRAMLSLPRGILDSLQQQRERGIRSDETTRMLTRRHPWAFAGKALRGMLLFALLLGLALVSTRVKLLPAPLLPLGFLTLAVILPGLMGLYYFLEWRNDYFVITNQRVVHEERYLMTGSERREQALLNSVQNVTVERHGIIAELIGFGDVVISTAGNAKAVVLDTIPNPVRVQQMIFSQIQQNKSSGALDNPAAVRAQIDALFTPAPNAVPANVQAGPAGMAGIAMPPPVPGAAYPATSTGTASSGPRQPTSIIRLVFPRTRTVDGDRIIYRKHPIILLYNLWRPMLFYFALSLLVLVRLSGRVAFMQQIPTLVLVAIGLLWVMLNTFWLYWAYADWYEDLYILDSQFVTDIKRRPLWLNENRKQAGLQQIQNVTSQIGGVWGQLLNYGSVLIQTAAEQGSMEFTAVENPKGVAEEILQRVQQRAEQQAAAGQDEQRRLMAEYLAAYHQATRNEAQAQFPATSGPSNPVPVPTVRPNYPAYPNPSYPANPNPAPQPRYPAQVPPTQPTTQPTTQRPAPGLPPTDPSQTQGPGTSRRGDTQFRPPDSPR